MKSVNSYLFPTFLLIAVVQFGCLSGGVMDNAEKLVEAKDYSGALEAYQNIVDARPGTTDARAAQLAIGQLYIEHMNQPEQGIKTYEAIIAEAPTSDEAAEAHYRHGMYVYHQKDYEAAQTHFNIIVDQFAHLKLSHNAQLLLAKCYENRQKFEQAVQAYDNFVQQNPQNQSIPQILAHKARIQLNNLKNDEEAIRTLGLLVRKYNNTESAESYVKEAKKVLSEFNLSPFGFGPYPEVPADYPYQERLWDNVTPEHELAVRVRIKLWKQGIRTEGIMFDPDNGLIYPTIPGVLYVQWQNAEEDDPEFAGRRYASLIMGDPDTGKKWQSLYLTKEGFERLDVTPDEVKKSGIAVYVYPNGTKVYEYPDGGIDPYKFLGLTR